MYRGVTRYCKRTSHFLFLYDCHSMSSVKALFLVVVRVCLYKLHAYHDIHMYAPCNARDIVCYLYIWYTCKLDLYELMVAGIISMEDGKQELAELPETRIFTWELSVSLYMHK